MSIYRTELIQKTRPCYVKGRKGMFHRWIDKEDVFLKCNVHVSDKTFHNMVKTFKETNIPPIGCDIETVKNTYALIEFEDGRVEEIPPTTITFLDTGYFKDYAWEVMEKNDGSL